MKKIVIDYLHDKDNDEQLDLKRWLRDNNWSFKEFRMEKKIKKKVRV